MPYDIRKRGDEFCVHKTEDNKRVGCHSTRTEAARQIATIEANEDKSMPNKQKPSGFLTLDVDQYGGKTNLPKDRIKATNDPEFPLVYEGDDGTLHKLHKSRFIEFKSMPEDVIKKGAIPWRQDEVTYVPVTVKRDTKCGNCRWFRPAGLGGESSCQIVEGYPEPILATGWCDQWATREPDLAEPEPLEVVVVEERGYIAPPAIKQGVIDKLRGKRIPATMVYRHADGLRRGIIVTSNSYEDRESEFLSTDALKAYVDSCYTDDGHWQGDNKFMMWHTLDIGDVIAVGMYKEFLIEGVEERDHPVAKAAWDYWQRDDTGIQWAASHGFLNRGQQENVYETIRKFETTILPLEAAANLLTYGRIIPMVKTMEEVFDAAFFPGAGALVVSGEFNKLSDGLLSANVEHKAEGDNSADTPAQVTVLMPPEVKVSFASALAMMSAQVEAQATLQTELDAVKAVQAERTKAIDERNKAQDADDQHLLDRIKALEGALALTPRASQSVKNVMADDDTVGDKTAAEIAAEVSNEPGTEAERFGFTGPAQPSPAGQ